MNVSDTYIGVFNIYKDIAVVKLVFNNVDKNKGKENKGQKKASWIGRTFIELSFMVFSIGIGKLFKILDWILKRSF